jgi:hypothetical protein
MLRLRHALFIVGLLTVVSSVMGCAVYSRPGYMNDRWHYDHRAYGHRW